MTRARQDRVLAHLVRSGDWVTAATLADLLGVTPRSIRSYVTGINARVANAVESGPSGYRAAEGAAEALRHDESDAATPRDRLHQLARALLADEDGIDVYAVADAQFVSEATVEADLARLRGLVVDSGVVLERSGARVRLRGSEGAHRRLLSALIHDEMEEGPFDLHAMRRALGDESVGPIAFGPFKAELAAALGEAGYFVNEYGIGDVVMHIAIAADRVRAGHPLEGGTGQPGEAQQTIAALIDRLVRRHLGVTLGGGDRTHLATLVLTRVVAPGAAGESRAVLDPELLRTVAEVIAEAADVFAVDLAAPAFVTRLALHVQNLRLRASEQAWSRNPLTRSLKSSYPMIFEIAVFIAGRIQERLGFAVLDDEIAYIAMHVGGQLERSRSDALLTATIVCPGYYELHELLRSSVDRSLGQAIEVVEVVTSADPAWSSFDTDLVLTTIDPPLGADPIVRIQPFLTPADVERVQTVAARLRRARRLARLRQGLERYFDERAFVRGVPAGGEEETIQLLGERLAALGVIDQAAIDSAIERERLSSTAFTDALAVPHAMEMTATRTAIAVGIAEQPVRWGGSRVQVVAFAAFSPSDRAAFQAVFEQLVEVFSERESVQRIVRRGTDFGSFLDELVAVIDG